MMRSVFEMVENDRKHGGKREKKMLVTSIFSYSHNVFKAFSFWPYKHGTVLWVMSEIGLEVIFDKHKLTCSGEKIYRCFQKCLSKQLV